MQETQGDGRLQGLQSKRSPIICYAGDFYLKVPPVYTLNINHVYTTVATVPNTMLSVNYY